MYAHKLHSLDRLLIAIEVYLGLGFAVHIGAGLWLTAAQGKLSITRFSWTSARLALSGAVVLIFLLLHVRTFRFGPWYTTVVDGKQVRDLWRLQKEVFSDPKQVTLPLYLARKRRPFHYPDRRLSRERL